jgi:hypothetical protein
MVRLAKPTPLRGRTELGFPDVSPACKASARGLGRAEAGGTDVWTAVVLEDQHHSVREFRDTPSVGCDFPERLILGPVTLDF